MVARYACFRLSGPYEGFASFFGLRYIHRQVTVHASCEPSLQPVGSISSEVTAVLSPNAFFLGLVLPHRDQGSLRGIGVSVDISVKIALMSAETTQLSKEPGGMSTVRKFMSMLLRKLPSRSAYSTLIIFATDSEKSPPISKGIMPDQ